MYHCLAFSEKLTELLALSTGCLTYFKKKLVNLIKTKLILVKDKIVRDKEKLTIIKNGVMYFQHNLKMTLGYDPVMSSMMSHICSAPEKVTAYKWDECTYVLTFQWGFQWRFNGLPIHLYIQQKVLKPYITFVSTSQCEE